MADVRDGALHVQQGKIGARIAIEGELAALLERLRARPVLSAWLLTDADGQHLNHRRTRERFNAARERAGVEDFMLKDLRAKSATDTTEGASDRLGHASNAITKRVYIRNPRAARPTK